MNNATIFGKVVTSPEYSHRVYGESFFNLTLEIPRLTEGVSDMVPVTFSECLFEYQINVGDYIGIEGQVRTYNKFDEKEGKKKLFVTVFAKNVIYGVCETCNIVEFEGFLCKKPNYRITPFGREIADLHIAVNRQFSGFSDYIPCITWGRNASFCERLEVGAKLEIIGRFQSRVYGKVIDGIKIPKTTYEISVKTLYVK